jgi:CheY-like chemotaxis protein
MDGWGLLDIIHEEGFNKKKVIMVTSSVDQEDKTRQHRIQNNSFCRKTV